MRSHHGHVKAHDLVLIEQKCHARRFRSCLLAISAGAQEVFAIAEKIEFDVDVALSTKPSHPAIRGIAGRGTRHVTSAG